MTTDALPQPKSIESWLALPELPMGDYTVFNVGVCAGELGEARARGLPDVPARDGDESGLLVPLPNVEVIEQGHPVMYRLPLMFGAIVRHMYEDAGRLHAAGQRLLPARFRFARRPDGSAIVAPIGNSN